MIDTTPRPEHRTNRESARRRRRRATSASNAVIAAYIAELRRGALASEAVSSSRPRSRTA